MASAFLYAWTAMPLHLPLWVFSGPQLEDVAYQFHAFRILMVL